MEHKIILLAAFLLAPLATAQSDRQSKPFTLGNILLGDVRVMSGQNNMAYPLIKTNGNELVNHWNEMKTEAEARLEYRKLEEAKRAMEIYERLKTLGK